MLNQHGNYSSERGQKASSKFGRLKALVTRRRDDAHQERKFMIEEREDGPWIRPIPRRT